MRPNRKRSINVKFVERVRKYDGPYVPSFHDKIVPSQEFPKMRDQKMPDFDDRRNCGDRTIDSLVPQIRLRIVTVDGKNQLLILKLKFECRLLDLADHAAPVIRADPMFTSQPRDPAIQRAAIDVRKIEPPGELSRYRALP